MFTILTIASLAFKTSLCCLREFAFGVPIFRLLFAAKMQLRALASLYMSDEPFSNASDHATCGSF